MSTNDYEWECSRSMAGCAAALVRAALPQYRGKCRREIVRVLRFVELWEQKQWIDPVEINRVASALVFPNPATHVVISLVNNAAWIVIATRPPQRYSSFRNMLEEWHLTGLDDSERDVIVGRWVVKDIERALGRRLGNTVRKAALAAAVIGEYETAAFLVEKS